MTSEKAIVIADEFVRNNRLSVELPALEARVMPAARFNALFGREVYPCDFWIVEYLKILEPGVAAVSPASELVQNIPTTGEVYLWYMGMT